MNKDRFRFRVWDKKSGAYDSQTTFILFDDGTLGEFDYGSIHNQDWYVVEQYTGLKDKNGNLIYEGDIVKIGNGSVNGEVIESELAVEWVDKVGRYNLPSWTSDVPDWSHYIEIIGNVHQTKE